MIRLLLITLLSSGPGASMRTGSPSPGVLQGTFSASSIVDRPGATMHAPANGEITALHGENLVVGSNGSGSTMTVALKVGSDVLCTLDVPCASLGDFTSTCTGAFSEGQDVHMQISASGCDVKPMFIGAANILWR